MITDEKRIDFIQDSLKDDDICSFKSYDGQHQGNISLFTIKAQHQYGNTLREVIDKTMLYEPRPVRKGPKWFEKVFVDVFSCGIDEYIKVRDRNNLASVEQRCGRKDMAYD